MLNVVLPKFDQLLHDFFNFDLATHINTAGDFLNLVINLVQLWPVRGHIEKWSWVFYAAAVELCCTHHAMVYALCC